MCEDWRRLLGERQAAVNLYSEKVTQLQEHTGLIPLTDYQLLAKAVERTRLRAWDAHRAFLKHVAEHKCDPRSKNTSTQD